MKPIAHADDLALLGAPRAFPEPLHVGRPNIGGRDRTLARIGEALDRRWLTNDGPLVAEFEARVAELCGVEHCVAVSSATVGLQLVARALELTGEVIVPSFTFVGTAHALSWIGLEPVFCDIDPDTHLLDPRDVERMIGPRTSAILGVHLWGRPCAIEPLTALAAEHDLPLLFDAAHALGCTHRSRPLGGFGRAEVFSFHATKVAGTGEGGAITTDDGDLAARLRLTRNFGFTGYDTVDALATNAKMGELPAALGLTSLEHLDAFVAANRRNHAAYARGLDGLPGVRLISGDEGHPGRGNLHYVVVEIGPDAPLTRDDVLAVLTAEGVLARRYFHPGCHRLTPYATGVAPRALPATEAVCDRVLVLPTGTAVTEDDIATVTAAMCVALATPEAVRGATGSRAAGRRRASS